MSSHQDSEILKNDGDLIVCIGQDAEMRMESTVIHSSKYACLIDGIQGSNSTVDCM